MSVVIISYSTPSQSNPQWFANRHLHQLSYQAVQFDAEENKSSVDRAIVRKAYRRQTGL